MRFVLLEDDEVAARGVAWALEAYGHEVAVAQTGVRFFAIIADSRPDAIILDISLRDEDDHDGITIARDVRERWPAMPIIFTTGHGTYPGLEDALRERKTRLLQKPYDIELLIATAREMSRDSAPGAGRETRDGARTTSR